MKNLKKVLSCLVTVVFAISCTKIDNVFNGNKDSNRFGIPTENVNFKISNEPIVPKILTFESKVPIKPLKLVKKLPEGRNFDFRFEVNPKKLKKNMIKISENGDFKLTIKKGNKFSVIDNDATDGNATIEIPENVINTFIGIPEKDEDEHRKVTGSINIEDKLYYAKQEIKPLSKKELEAIFDKDEKEDEKEDEKKFETKKDNSEKDKENNEGWYTGEREDGTWYQIGKRPLPIPSEWKSDDGNDYVLSFKNQGIKQFDFKGYKVSNPKDYEYPDGINLIGTKGGTVSLTGVGKIEIPEGALDKEIFISIKQEASAPEILEYGGKSVGEDYISPIIRVEPFGLALKKSAFLTLELDKKRLGSNTPLLAMYGTNESKYPIKPKLGNWWDYVSCSDYNTPAVINKFQYFTRTISTRLKPNMGVTPFTIDDLKDPNFKINSLNPLNLLAEYVTDSSHFVFFKTPMTTLKYNDIENILLRSELAYSYYQTTIKEENPNIWFDYKGKKYIPMYLYGYMDTKPSISGVLDKKVGSNYVNSEMYLPGDQSVEHEIWHLFQHKNIASLPNSSDFYDMFVGGEYNWIQESSAEHVGARCYKYFKDTLQNSLLKAYKFSFDMQTTYENNLENGIKSLSDSKSIPYEQPYYEAGFFTFLLHKDTLGIGFTKSLFKDISLTFSNPKHTTYIGQFHDYALHTLFKDRFDIYQVSTSVIPDTISLKPDKNNQTNKNSTSVSLTNNSAKYLEFKLDVTSPRVRSLGLMVKPSGSGCESSSKIRVLFYDASGKIVVLPQYLDSSTEEIDKEYLDLGMFTEKKALNLKTGLIHPFFNFGEDFSKAVLIISNSNGKLGTGNTCKYEVESCLLCF